MNIMREIALIGFAQTLFFSLLILTKRKREIKDYILTIFLILVGAELIYRFLLKTIPETENIWITLFDITYWALFGPVILLYVLFTINKVEKFKAVHLLHLIPLFIGCYAIKDYLFDSSGNISFIDYYIKSDGLTKVALYCWEFTSTLYLLYSLYILLKHKRSVKYYFSDISRKDLKWLTILISGFTIYILLSYLIWIIEGAFHYAIEFNLLTILPAALTIYVFCIGYFGYKQAGIFFDYPLEKAGLTRKIFRIANTKYVKSGLGDIECNEIIDRLNVLMNTDKPYMRNDLNISDLAKMLDTSLHKLSQVINGSFHQSFYDFINTYRIEEIKQLMKKSVSHNYTIISLAYECGFSSKSSFYNAFKKNTGTTPSEYIHSANTTHAKTAVN